MELTHTRDRRLFFALIIVSAISIFVVTSFTLNNSRSSLYIDANKVELSNAMSHFLWKVDAPSSEAAELVGRQASKVDNKSDSVGCLVTRPERDDIVYRNDVWQVVYSNESVFNRRHEVLLYSTFYDDRDDVGNVAAVRILGLATGMSSLLYCQLWHIGYTLPVIVVAQVLDNGGGHYIRGRHYGQHMWSCMLHKNIPAPSHVSMTFNPCKQSTTLLPVIRTNKTTSYEHEFGVCVPISFWWIDPVPLVEWIEANILLGVGEINIYNCSISSPIEDVFKHYSNVQILKLFQLPPPVNDYSWDGVSVGSAISLNDCMLRNMYRYRYIVLIDFDELIIPRLTSNYTSLLKQIDIHHSVSHYLSYSFRNSYMFIGPSSDDHYPIFSRVLRNRLRSKPSDYLYGTKSFVDPRRCLSVFNHYCWIRFPQDSPSPFTLDVSQHLALSHHYRKHCGFSKEQCAALMQDSSFDDVMLSYSSKLLSSTRAVLQKLRMINTTSDIINRKYLRPDS